MQSFIVSFFTALVVSAGVSAAFHFGIADKMSPPPVVEKPDRVEVPNLTGMTLDEAKSVLKKKDLVVGKIEEKVSKTIAKGKVISTAPARLSKVRGGTVIEIVASAGSNTVKVPELKRLTASKAKKALKAVGLKLGIDYGYHDDFPLDRVMSQVPGVGADVAPGSVVTVMINDEEWEE